MPALVAIAFDLDDTLYPERDYVRSGYRAVAQWVQETLGLSAGRTQTELESLFERGDRGRVFDLWLESKGLAAGERLSPMVAVYRSHDPDIQPYPEVRETLADLVRRGYRLGLVTEGHAEVQERKLRALALGPCFEAVVITGVADREAWKPDPRPFRRLLDEMALAPSLAAYVGDNPQKDFLGARRAGMLAVRLRRADGLHSREDPPTPEEGPDLEIGNLGELLSRVLTAGPGERGPWDNSPPAGWPRRSVEGGAG